jgi:hypothetical protein
MLCRYPPGYFAIKKVIFKGIKATSLFYSW